MKTPTASQNKQGFTLIELICVIAVIAFLFALVLPSLSRSKQIATRVVCGSNMRRFSTLYTIYLDEFDNQFPSPAEWFYAAQSDTAEHPIGCRWHDWPMAIDGEIMEESPDYQGMMWEYISEISKATCPDFRDFAKKRGCENPSHNSEIDIRPQFNYTMNAYLGSDIEGGVKNTSQVTKPSTTFFFAEENSWSVQPNHPNYPVRWLKAPLSTKALDDTALLITPTPRAENCFGTFHGASKDLSDGYSNLAFLDGHVDTISVEQQLRNTMHGPVVTSDSSIGTRRSLSRSREKPDPAGNLRYAWPSEERPPGGWDAQ